MNTAGWFYRQVQAAAGDPPPPGRQTGLPTVLAGQVEIWRTAPAPAVAELCATVRACGGEATVVTQPDDHAVYPGACGIDYFPAPGFLADTAAHRAWRIARHPPCIIIPVNNQVEDSYLPVKELALAAPATVYTVWRDGWRRYTAADLAADRARAAGWRRAGACLALWRAYEQWCARRAAAAWEKDDPAVPLATTFERVRPILAWQVMFREHLSRYRRAQPQAVGKIVLDIGSGEGYGAAQLAGQARFVVGIELAADAVRFAAAKYRSATLAFVRADARQLPFRSGVFSLVTAFEVFEHLTEPERLLREARQCLTPAGVLLFGTPNADTYPAGNHYHVREYRLAEVQELLQPHFSRVEVQGMRGNEKLTEWHRRMAERGTMLQRYQRAASRLGWRDAMADHDGILRRAQIALTGYDEGSIGVDDFVFSSEALEAAAYFYAECRV